MAIADVQPDRFTLYIHEAPNKDGSRTTETVSYVVLEAGTWEVADGVHLQVGTRVTTATVGLRISNVWAPVTFSETFSSTPVVLSQVQSNDDPHWVKTRQHNVSAGGFDVALEEEEASASPHGTETIGWLAIDAGQGAWNGHLFEAIQTPEAVTHDWYSIGFGQSFGQAPRFVATLATYNSANGCALRYQNLAAGGVEVKVEEDTTWDSETNHTGEGVAYLAVEGDGLLTAEVSGGETYTETLYYYFGGQRVAMRQDGVLYFIVGDHLGTTSAVFDASEALHSQSRHYPYGTERWATGAVPTEFRFTGQRFDSYIKLTVMGARWYDAQIGRWVSADSLVPNPSNPRSYNRLSYAYNNPLQFWDPSGHSPQFPKIDGLCGTPEACLQDPEPPPSTPEWLEDLQSALSNTPLEELLSRMPIQLRMQWPGITIKTTVRTGLVDYDMDAGVTGQMGTDSQSPGTLFPRDNVFRFETGSGYVQSYGDGRVAVAVDGATAELSTHEATLTIGSRSVTTVDVASYPVAANAQQSMAVPVTVDLGALTSSAVTSVSVRVVVYPKRVAATVVGAAVAIAYFTSPVGSTPIFSRLVDAYGH